MGIKSDIRVFYIPHFERWQEMIKECYECKNNFYCGPTYALKKDVRINGKHQHLYFCSIKCYNSYREKEPYKKPYTKKYSA